MSLFLVEMDKQTEGFDIRNQGHQSQGQAFDGGHKETDATP